MPLGSITYTNLRLRSFIWTWQMSPSHIHHPSKASSALWHCHLSHISEDTILRMVQSEAITGMEVVGDRSGLCSACHKHKGKETWNMIPKVTKERSSKVLG